MINDAMIVVTNIPTVISVFICLVLTTAIRVTYRRQDDSNPIMENPKGPPVDEKKSFQWRAIIIGPIITIHMFCYMGPLFVVQQYAYFAIQKEKFPELNHTGPIEFTCESNTSSDKYTTQLKIQQETSTWLLYLSLASGIPAIFVTFLLSCYTDRFGRKPILLLPLIGLFIKTGLSALAVYLEWNIYTFIIFYIIEGLSGAQLGPFIIGVSIAADLTKPGKNRSFGIALIDVAVGLGVVLGSITSGYLIQALGFAHPLTLAAGLYFFDILLVLVFLPETFKFKKSSKSVPLMQNIRNAYKFYVDRKLAKEGKRWIYIICTIIYALVQISTVGKYQIDTLYELNAPFCWQSVQIGIFGTLRSVAIFNIGIPSIRLFQRCFSDESIAVIGLVSSTLSLILEGLAPNSIVLYLVPIVGFGSMMAVPLAQGIMSKITPADQQGALFSGSGAVSAICNVIGGVFANGIYTGTVGIYRGFAYLLMAIPSLLGIVLCVILKVRQDRRFNEKELYVENDIKDTEVKEKQYNGTALPNNFDEATHM